MQMDYIVMYIIHISKCYMYTYNAIIMISYILYLTAINTTLKHVNTCCNSF